ncbi:MAG: glycosyltransferase family 4 protein, partial [Terrimicrobiaceae bacterium]
SCATAANQRFYGTLQSVTGWEVTLVIPARWKDEFGNRLDEPTRPELGDRVKKFPVLVNGNIIFHAYLKNWGNFLNQGRFDAIYVNHEPYAVATAQLCLANLRQSTPAAFGFYSCQNIAKKYPFPFSAMERMVYRHSPFAFPITDAVADVLRAKGYQGTSTVCPLPLDPGQYRPRGEPEDRGLIPRAEGETVIGFVGRFIEAKGLRTLALALCEVADLSWKLVMIGTGEFEAEFHGILKSRGLGQRAAFLGYVPHDETPRFLSAFDLLVLPSETQPNWKEQFGRVITESLACGTPVLGSDSGEIPNLITASGGGMVFPERNVPALAAALRKILLDPEWRREHGVRGMVWTNSHISLQAVANTMAGTINHAVERKTSHAFATS